jgi:prolipoprotein diacylglyceryltransferase
MVTVGRIGCFLSGLPDFTYRAPTTSVFGYDFGDGVLRHPVQLCESAAMAMFAVACLAGLTQRRVWAVVNGLYFVGLFYGAQRFIWEFLKPYGGVVGPFTIFHILSLLLVIYGVTMLAAAPKPAAGIAS